MNEPRQRPLTLTNLRAFEAVARRLSFRAAAEELHLTQPAISRQIRALEDELGATLFLRGTRHVSLTPTGATLQRSVDPLLAQLDSAVRHIRSSQGRQPVGVATWASFASLWLLPRLVDFHNQYPASDVRIAASDHLAAADDPQIDLALRYGHPDHAPAGSVQLFGEWLSPVASPALLRRLPLRRVSDLAKHTLLEEDDQRPSAEYLTWRHWLRLQQQPHLEPRRWVYMNFTYQQVQAALAGQGVALARLALVHESLARGELVEPFGPAGRITSPYAYWLVRWPHRQERPALSAFEAWVLQQAEHTRAQLQMPAAPV